MRPMSDSAMLAFTCIFARSCAITKSVGACMLAATVCPTSTLREITIPSMGALMIVWPRLTVFWFSDARAWTVCARAALTPASAARAFASAVSRSVVGISFCSDSSRARLSLRWASSAWTTAR
jgi:hypothetical protein